MSHHLPEVAEEIRHRLPKVPVQRHSDAERWSVVAALAPSGNVGIELGVAGGGFSARMVRSGRFTRFYGVDAYTGGHSVKEYKAALLETGLWSDYRLLRMSFSQAVDLFPDASFDFIYVDGYAHSGCEGGRTLEEWFPKLKPGGTLAGDDYDLRTWPLVVAAVHEMAAQLKTDINVAARVARGPYDRFPSWSIVRPEDAPDQLVFSDWFRRIADAEKARIDELRKRARQQLRQRPPLGRERA